jgi:hypothetical protein
MGVVACDIFSIEQDLSLLWVVITCDTVQETRLPCAIGANDADQFTCMNGEVNVMECHDTPKV